MWTKEEVCLPVSRVGRGREDGGGEKASDELIAEVDKIVDVIIDPPLHLRGFSFCLYPFK